MVKFGAAHIMELASGVHHFRTDPFNWYVIEEAGRITLVDAGFPGHFRVFEKGLAAMGRALKDVEAVILTHAHADHMGFADHVARLAKAPIYIHAADLSASRRPMRLPWAALLWNAWRPFMAGVLGRAMVNGVFSMTHPANPHSFQGGDILKIPGMPYVIHTPGHTAGEVSFYLAAQRVLITGDSLVTQDLYSGEAGDPQLTRRSLNENYVEARQSVQCLKDLGRVRILPGHGVPWEGEIAEAIEIALRKPNS